MVAAVTFASLWFVFLAPVRAQIGALGVMGDSLSDEYFEESYGAYAANWVPQLANYRGIDIGPTAAAAGQPGGTWGIPRRTGYAYDWAYSGDTSADLLTHGQHTGLAAQVIPDGITHAVLAIGANDFNPSSLSGAYSNIYYNFWSTTQINNYVAQVLANIETALATVRSTGVKLVVLNILDYGRTPAVYTSFFYSNASNRDRVTAVIQRVNDGIAALGQKYQVPVLDAFRMQNVIFGPNTNLKNYLYLGNVAINLKASDSNPITNPNRTAAFVEDSAHPHTTIQGLFANGVLEAFRLGWDTDVPRFTEAEILTHADVSYGGTDTLASQIGAYGDYVILPARPRIVGIHVAAGVAQVEFTSVANQSYRVEVSDNLGHPSWSLLSNNLPGSGGIVVATDQDAANHRQRFYRVRQLP